MLIIESSRSTHERYIFSGTPPYLHISLNEKIVRHFIVCTKWQNKYLNLNLKEKFPCREFCMIRLTKENHLFFLKYRKIETSISRYRY